MKKLLPFFLLLLALPAIAQDRDYPGMKVNGIRLGVSYRTVLRKFGKPRKVKVENEDDGSGAPRRIVTYPGITFEFLKDYENEYYYVAVIAWTSPKWRQRGLGVGSTGSAVRKRFGEPWVVEGAKPGEKDWQYLISEGGDRGRIVFTIRKGRVTSIYTYYSC